MVAQTTFSYTGGVQTYTVPPGITSLTVDLKGAKGGDGYPVMSVGGLGGRVTGTLTVTPGQVLNVYVGGVGANGTSNNGGAGGYNGGGQGGTYSGSYTGGGGGGASDIRQAPYGLADRLAVAGGGGGAAFDYSTPNWERGGAGGGTTGETGYHGNVLGQNGYPGYGGSQVAGGAPGNFPSYCVASAGALGVGGAAGTCTNSGGGGGGGYYGGGGGVWAGGGGGSSYLPGGTHTQGFQTGNGEVVITPVNNNPPCTAPSSVTAAPTTICAGASVNLSAISTGNTIYWYTVPTGGTSIGNVPSGSNFSVSPTVTTTYYAEAYSGVCSASPRVSVVVTVNTPSVAPTSISGGLTVCNNGSTTLSQVGGTLGTGATYNWYSGTCGGTPVGTGTSVTLTPTSTTTYFVRAEGTCNTTTCVSATVNVGAPPAATGVTATPSSICPGGTSNLTAISTGNVIDWYLTPTGGTMIGTSPSGANFAVTPSTTTTYYAEANSTSAAPGSQTFAYTGGVQSFTVPPGVTTLTVDVQGAAGGVSTTPLVGPGGNGGRVTGSISVTPGQILNIYVGGAGGNGTTTVPGAGGYNGGAVAAISQGNYSGGGGGGASDIRVSPYGLADRVAVAGGGGGGAYNYSTAGYDRGGMGGGTTGETGYGGGTMGGQGAGTGGSQIAGGIGGTYSGYCTATNGALGLGGAGGTCTNTGGGGGGGYYGGGGGVWGGGGGGSSFLTGGVHTQGFRAGNGQVIVSWTGNGGGGCVSTTRVPVTVSMETTPPTANCVPVTVTLNVNGNGSTTAAAVGSTSTDNCAVDTMTLAQTAFTCADAGTNSVVLTVTDVSGNTATCTAAITVVGQPVTASANSPASTCGFNVSCAGASDGSATVTGTGGCPPFTYLWSNFTSSQTATNLGAGTYTVTVTDGGGSTSVATVVLTQPTPLQLTYTTTSSCAGSANGAINLTTSGGNNCTGYTYAWSNGAISEDLTNVAAGNYTVTVSDPVGCSTTQTITVGTLAASNPQVLQTGNTLTSMLTWVTYQWLLNGNPIPGATGNNYTATQTGTYTLMVTDTSGCSGTSAPFTITITGISQNLGDGLQLTLYPNPASGEFRLRTAAPIGYGLTVEIHDIFGRTILQQALPELGHEVAYDIRGFARGTYIVEVKSDLGERRLLRLVVQ